MGFGSGATDSDADLLAEVADGAGDLAFLVFLVCEFFVATGWGTEGGDCFAALSEFFEVGEGLVFAVVMFPELGLFVGELLGEPGDGLDEHGNVWAKLGPASEVFFPIHESFTGGGPCDFGTVVGLPDHVVAQAGAEDVFAEVFEDVQGVFEGPCGVAGIDVGADEIGACGFDEFGEFPGVEVTGVVLDGDLDVGFDGVGFAGFEDFDGVGDASADTAGRFAVFSCAEDDAVDG